MHIISATELRNQKDIVFVDARSGPDAQKRFLDGHIPGAVHADLDKDLADIKENAADGGRHPLPSPQQFAEWLGKVGITPDSHVVAYDDKSGANAAARFWWMLRALGHKNVQVVSGGMQALQKNGWELSRDAFSPSPVAPYPIAEWQSPLANINDVAAAAADDGQLVIDVREAYRYRGESEPIDKVAGHIPGAANLPYIENLDAEGNFLPKEVLKEKYENFLNGLEPRQVTVHCGSGVTACHTILALEEAGFSGAKLYVGSWSEWSRNDKPIATGDQR
ncbi:MAG: sulfurtransferase [Chitinophagaceae bacterium]|nr:sulfurtransferase [Chitinophagaceae bacterium]